MKSLSAKELKKLIIETVQEEKKRFKGSRKKYSLTSLIEDADPTKVDTERFPHRLRAAAKAAGDPDIKAKGGLADGNKQDDVIDQKEWSGNVGMLKPSQNSMDIYKLCNFFIGACRQAAGLSTNKPFSNGPGGKIDCIISGDGYIMDGHHRWGALCMYDPESQVGPDIQLMFPAVELIAALNAITVHLTGKTVGKSGKTALSAAFGDSALRGQIKSFMDDPTSCWGCDGDGDSLNKVLKSFSGFDGDGTELLDSVMKKINSNLSTVTLDPVKDSDGLFAREDMPVISPEAGHVMKAAKMLAAGQVDLNPPYADPAAGGPDYQQDGATAAEPASEAPARENTGKAGDVILERWHKLAGLLKD